MKATHEKAQRGFKDELGRGEMWVSLFGASFDCCGDIQVGCLTTEISVFGEVTKLCLLAPFLSVLAGALQSIPYIFHLYVSKEVDLKEENVYTSKFLSQGVH